MTKAHFAALIVPLAMPFDDRRSYADGAMRCHGVVDAGLHGVLGTANNVPQIARALYRALDISALVAFCAVDLATFFLKVRDARGRDLIFQANGAPPDLSQVTFQFDGGAPC